MSWNYVGCPICENQVKKVNMALSVSPETVEETSFGFDIKINQQVFGLGEVTIMEEIKKAALKLLLDEQTKEV